MGGLIEDLAGSGPLHCEPYKCETHTKLNTTENTKSNNLFAASQVGVECICTIKCSKTFKLIHQRFKPRLTSFYIEKQLCPIYFNHCNNKKKKKKKKFKVAHSRFCSY